MPRPTRIDLPGVPQHLVARGNNKTALFHDDVDRRVFLRYIEEAALACRCDVHAFVLMTNHVHLLATGHENGAISRMMQAIGRRYGRYANRAHGRTGTLFEGRFKGSLIDSDRYLFTCMRYIELNPVRAGMVRQPGEYDWSSFRHNAGVEHFSWLVPRGEYQSLGKDRSQRAGAYRALFAEPIADADLEALRCHARKGEAVGGDEFLARIEAVLKRPVRVASPGRPRNRKK